MAQTPKKLVHWAVEYSKSPLASPASDASSAHGDSTSTLQYVNGQLCAHGFATSPGISLDGLSSASSEKVVKCLFAMLSQRMEDMNRTEELTTKLRTLSYDHERLLSLYKSALENAASAEREASSLKSKLTNASRTLAQSEAAHKHTTTELQRTRSAMQSLRATHAAETKKKEKEVERMTERWSKLSDSQLKLGNVRSGITMTCANAQAVEGREVGKNLVDSVLEDAEEVCRRLKEEHVGVKALVVDIAKAVQKILYKATSLDPDDFDYPQPLEDADIFGLPPADTAAEKLSSLLTSLRDAVVNLRSDEPRPSAEAGSSHPTSTSSQTSVNVEHLQKTIASLRSELDKAQKESQSQAAKAQALFDQIAAETPREQKPATNLAPSRDELAHLRIELEEQRREYDEAAVGLGKDRATFEVIVTITDIGSKILTDLQRERLDFLEEKRAWQIERLLNPGPSSSNAFEISSRVSSEPLPEEHFAPEVNSPPPLSPHKSPRRHKTKQLSPRKSPLKAHRPPRRGNALGKLNFAPAYETEVIPVPSSTLLPTAFILPPPSPQSRLPPRTGPLTAEPCAVDPKTATQQLHALFGDANAAPAKLVPSTTPPFTDPFDSSEEAPVASELTPDAAPSHPFPVAKPFAARMIHAYSPAKPSPLSRILKLADSPEGAPRLPAVFPATFAASPDSLSSLEEEESSPLYNKAETAATRDALPAAASNRTDNAAGKKGKRSLAASGEAEEKENTMKRRLKGPAARKPRPPPAASVAAVKVKSRPAASAPEANASGKPGPRRVPFNSAEAGWRG
ncbi:Afadin and alpha-actinin-binding-domain-containing protein [Vararia minispora EC-137]|uniref:Afadin and alpha-actinin-binding-domain-containing protein n=1 Tax=Vararia minispora EC-137 TaxID=1314806 RepID=A0ACB8QWM9_9AGAM|nr:Afadin and alpha-actinin-binding-domain-containing protein [Vararia minispora EC-137]